jgi:hypothetical protein
MRFPSENKKRTKGVKRMKDFRKQLLTSVAEYEHYYGKFNLIDFIAEHSAIETERDLIAAINGEIYKKLTTRK